MRDSVVQTAFEKISFEPHTSLCKQLSDKSKQRRKQ